MRAHYVGHVYGQLSDQYRGILITLDYPQAEMGWPAVFGAGCGSADIVCGAFRSEDPSTVAIILDKEPKFLAQGVSRLDTVVYRLQRTSSD